MMARDVDKPQSLSWVGSQLWEFVSLAYKVCKQEALSCKGNIIVGKYHPRCQEGSDCLAYIPAFRRGEFPCLDRIVGLLFLPSQETLDGTREVLQMCTSRNGKHHERGPKKKKKKMSGQHLSRLALFPSAPALATANSVKLELADPSKGCSG